MFVRLLGLSGRLPISHMSTFITLNMSSEMLSKPSRNIFFFFCRRPCSGFVGLLARGYPIHNLKSKRHSIRTLTSLWILNLFSKNAKPFHFLNCVQNIAFFFFFIAYSLFNFISPVFPGVRTEIPK